MKVELLSSRGPRRPATLAALTVIALAASLGACSGGKSKASIGATSTTAHGQTSATAATVPPGTVPAGPSLCDRLPGVEATRALGVAVSASTGATSISCVYASTDASHGSTLLSLTASDAGGKLDQLLAAARSAATTFELVKGLGDAAYTAVVGGRPQAALISHGRQYSLSLVVSRPLAPAAVKQALVSLLRALNAHLRSSPPHP